MGAGADGSALIGFFQQLGAVPGCLVHQDVAVLRSEDSAPVQGADDALQRRDLRLAVGYRFLIQYESLGTDVHACQSLNRPEYKQENIQTPRICFVICKH